MDYDLPPWGVQGARSKECSGMCLGLSSRQPGIEKNFAFGEVTSLFDRGINLKIVMQ